MTTIHIYTWACNPVSCVFEKKTLSFMWLFALPVPQNYYNTMYLFTLKAHHNPLIFQILKSHINTIILLSLWNYT